MPFWLNIKQSMFIYTTEPAVIEPPLELSTDEESALAYVGGYIIRSLREKIERSKPELML